MEIKPADKPVVDHRDNRYSRHNRMTTKWVDGAISAHKKLKEDK